MDPFILILCIAILFLSFSCLVAVIVLYARIGKLNDGKQTEKKLEELKESIYNEFSRNRSEQAASAQAQRTEVSKQISEINKRLEALTETNNAQLVRIFKEMSVGINTIREKNA